MSVEVKKSAEKFGGFKKKTYLCGMITPKYHITAINQLTGEREAISRPMELIECTARLAREQANRKYQRYKSHSRLRIDKVDPVQLNLKFDENEV